VIHPLVIDVLFLNAIYHTHKMKSGDNHGPPSAFGMVRKTLTFGAVHVCHFAIFRPMEQK